MKRISRNRQLLLCTVPKSMLKIPHLGEQITSVKPLAFETSKNTEKLSMNLRKCNVMSSNISF